MRHAVRDAVDRIDAALRRSPHDCGESRDSIQRMLLDSPVGVLFTIDDAHRQVRVLSIWQY